MEYLSDIKKNTEFFASRLTHIRLANDVSARGMSTELGMNPGYINNLENANGLPSFEMFFDICEYLNVSAAEFFDDSLDQPSIIHEIHKEIVGCSREQLLAVLSVLKSMKATGVPTEQSETETNYTIFKNE